jgi:hypothetical protein
MQRFALRIPPDMYTRIIIQAQQHRRSINAEVLTLLDEALLARAHHAQGEQTDGQSQETARKS